MRIFIVSVIVLVAYLAAFFLVDAFDKSSWGFDAIVTDSNSWYRNLIVSISTYLGILSQVLTMRIQKKTNKEVSEEVEIFALLNQTIKTKDFWLAVFVSPLVLIVAFQAVAQQSSLLFVGFIGFQNGFFFRSILSSSIQIGRGR